MQLRTQYLYKLFFAFSILVFLVFLVYRIVFIFYPNPSAAGVDNNVVYFIQRVLDGSTLYTDPSQPPYAVAQYGPFYYYLAAAVCRIGSVSPDNVMGIFEISKLICLFLNFLFAGTIFIIGKKIFALHSEKCWFLALITFIFIEVNSFARADGLEHLFYFISFYYFLLAVKKQENQQQNSLEYSLSAVIAVLALLSKQSAISLPVIVFLWLLHKREYKIKLLIYTLSFIIVLAGALLLLHSLTGIKVIYLNAVLGLDNGIQLGAYWQYIIVNFYQLYGCLWILGFIVIYARLRKETGRLFRCLAFALVIQFMLTNIFALKYGSASNYFTNWWTMLFIPMAIYWDEFAKIADNINRRLSIIILFFFLFLKTALIIQPIVEKIRTRPQRMAFYEMENNLAKHVRSMHDSSRNFIVFCNLFSPDSYLNNLLFRNVIIPQYDIVSLASYPRRVYDYRDLQQRLRDGTVEFVITKGGEGPLKFLDIELTNYIPVEMEGPYKIYRYKPALK